MKKALILLLGLGMMKFGLAQCPQANFTSTAPACQNTPVDFTNTSGNSGGGWTYYWDFDYPNGGGSSPSTSTSQNPTNIDYSGGGNGTYTVSFTITNAGMGCSSTAFIDIDIRKARADFLTSANIVCEGDSLSIYNQGTLGSSPTASVTHIWTFGVGATPSTSNAVNPPSVIYSTPGIKTITHYVSVNYSVCGSTRDDMVSTSIVVNPKPIVSFTSTAPVCKGDAVDFTYTGSTSSADMYNWDFGTNAYPSTGTSSNPMGITYFSGGTKNVYLTVTNQYGCFNSNNANIVINSLPTPNAGFDTTICANSTVQLGETNNPNYGYSWFPSSSLLISDPTISNPVASPVSGTTAFVLTVTDNTTNCVNIDTVVVTMLDPLVADAGVDEVICRYDSVQVGISLLQGQYYSWSPTSGISNSGISNPVTSPASTTTYKVTVTDDYGCPSESDEVTVIVHPLPIANAGVDDTITVGSFTQLTATNGVQFTWSPAYGLSNSGIFNPIARPDSTTTYIVTVTDIYGCVQTDTMNVVVLTPHFWYPTAFTPDGDGLNDAFYIRGEGLTQFEFLVFDQWGHTLFYSTDQTIGWDGKKFPNGELLPQGAYVFSVSAVMTNGEAVNENGLINLIR